uniref:BTB domain-containing protein n=1 Tax=Steinernema glaseri TaxID=37863 RepID=A0A1I7YFL0_9BILA
MIPSQLASGGVVALHTRQGDNLNGSSSSEVNKEELRKLYQSHDEHNPDDVEARLPFEKVVKSSVKIEDAILRLNIGGASYRIRTRSIVRYGPTTLLGRLCRMDHDHRKTWADSYFDDSDEYFFERVPRYFDPIYDFYATGKLHVPKDLCFDKFMAELRFWAVSKSKMDECCSPFAQYCILPKAPKEQVEKDHFIGVRCANIRRRLWLVLEGHSTSRWWKAFEITSTSFVVLSIAALILGSIPEFQVPEQDKQGLAVTAFLPYFFPTWPDKLPDVVPFSVPVTYPTYPKGAGYTVSSTTVVKNGQDARPEMVEHPVFNYVENICVIYFTFEYLLRLWVAPRKFAFAKQLLNIIDLLAIAPFIFEMILIMIGLSGENVRKVRWAFLTVRLLRVLRVVRIAKLGRFSPGLANFALTLQKSKKQMQMVAIVMLTVVIFFSTLVYFLEKDEPDSTFTSIPAAFWWAVVTMSTVGYGDSVPKTVVGKLVGSGAIVCGVMVLALPITIMVNNFMQVVKLREEKIIKKYAQQHGDQV